MSVALHAFDHVCSKIRAEPVAGLKLDADVGEKAFRFRFA
jgi:hypothetical protein